MVSAGSRSLQVQDVALGRLKRRIVCLAVSHDDAYGYAGTMSGDLLKFGIAWTEDGVPAACNLIGCYAKRGRRGRDGLPTRVCYGQGVMCVLILEDGRVLAGAGDGTVDLLEELEVRVEPRAALLQPVTPHLRSIRSTKLRGGVTSLELLEAQETARGGRAKRSGLLLVGTRDCEIYAVPVETFAPVLVVTCHRGPVNCVAFPDGMSEVFLTGGAGSVRVWSLQSALELLRVVVPHAVCSAALFTQHGAAIVSAWDDGCIRAFTPLTGRLAYSIPLAHKKGASALDATPDGATLVSGGQEGQVRVWSVTSARRTLRAALAEHKAAVASIRVSPTGDDAVSAGADGSCILWDLATLTRRQVLYAKTLFSDVCYEPGGRQLLTVGSDRRVAYWEAGCGTLARELVASTTGGVNAVDVSPCGARFATAGEDRAVKLWRYLEGTTSHVGLAHAGGVACCRFSPDGQHLVSGCCAGAVVVWRLPEPGSPLPPLPLGARAREPRVPSKPVKVERIEAMDTHRSSIHAQCQSGDSAHSTSRTVNTSQSSQR